MAAVYTIPQNPVPFGHIQPSGKTGAHIIHPMQWLSYYSSAKPAYVGRAIYEGHKRAADGKNPYQGTGANLLASDPVGNLLFARFFPLAQAAMAKQSKTLTVNDAASNVANALTPTYAAALKIANRLPLAAYRSQGSESAAVKNFLDDYGPERLMGYLASEMGLMARPADPVIADTPERQLISARANIAEAAAAAANVPAKPATLPVPLPSPAPGAVVPAGASSGAGWIDRLTTTEKIVYGALAIGALILLTRR